MLPEKENNLQNHLTIDINCDLGEDVLMDGQPVEPLIMPLISSVNIACGAHAGSDATMCMCIELARKHGVSAGAHPSYPDRENFGRNPMNFPMDSLKALIIRQIENLYQLAQEYGARLYHVKPHGALYNTAAIDIDTARAIAQAVAEFDNSLVIFGLPGSVMQQAAREYKLPFAAEAFPDRAYNPDGTLVNRKLPGAVIHHPDEFIQRSLMMVQHKKVVAITGESISLRADTLCVHGDNPAAVQLLTRLREEFDKAGIRVKKHCTSNA